MDDLASIRSGSAELLEMQCKIILEPNNKSRDEKALHVQYVHVRTPVKLQSNFKDFYQIS